MNACKDISCFSARASQLCPLGPPCSQWTTTNRQLIIVGRSTWYAWWSVVEHKTESAARHIRPEPVKYDATQPNLLLKLEQQQVIIEGVECRGDIKQTEYRHLLTEQIINTFVTAISVLWHRRHTHWFTAKRMITESQSNAGYNLEKKIVVVYTTTMK